MVRACVSFLRSVNEEVWLSCLEILASSMSGLGMDVNYVLHHETCGEVYCPVMKIRWGKRRGVPTCKLHFELVQLLAFHISNSRI